MTTTAATAQPTVATMAASFAANVWSFFGVLIAAPFHIRGRRHAMNRAVPRRHANVEHRVETSLGERHAKGQDGAPASGSGDEVELARPRNCMGAAIRAELAQNVGGVLLHGVERDNELVGDLPVLPAVRNQA